MSKRIRFRLLGKRVSMSQEEWEQLKERFDEKNAVLITFTGSPEYYYEINIACSWCKKFRASLFTPDIGTLSVSCTECVWDKLDKKPRESFSVLGCIRALQQTLWEKYRIENHNCHTPILGGAIHLSVVSVSWTRGADVRARTILRCIQKELLTIEARRKTKP